MNTAYQDLLQRRAQANTSAGFEPVYEPGFLFDFQAALLDWSVRQGRAAVFADCGLGKGQPAGANVLTPTGWQAIGDLRIGDRVIAADGKPATVQGVYPKQEQDTYRIHFSDGVSIVVDLDHLHICRTNNDRQRGNPWRVLSTADLLASDNLRYGAEGKSRNYDIPVVRDVEFKSASLPIDSYVMGVLLGDGYLKGNVSISSADGGVLEECGRRLPAGVTLKHKSGYDWRVITGGTGNRRHPFRQALADLGLMGCLSAAKFVPSEYLFAAPRERLDLLRGLMDTDGYIGPAGTCQFYSVSVALADGVTHLIRSLGGVPTRTVKATSCAGKPGQPCHVVTFSLATHNPFFLARKAERWNPAPRDNGRWIDRIEFEKRQPTVCIRVDSADSSYVTEHFVVTHNTPLQLAWAENVVRKTNGRVLVLTPLAVSAQTVREAEKFGVAATRSSDGTAHPGITITNYERLHYFDPGDFDGVVCDESSILKSFDGKTRQRITDFMRKHQYRLLCTATAAPNDYTELGTSSEALGYLGHMDMLNRFFRNDNNNSATGRSHGHGPEWRLKGHAEEPFWRWVVSWARAVRRPSDIGFSDGAFVLPPLMEREHLVETTTLPDGMLFPLVAVGLHEQRAERRRTIPERCAKVAELVDHSKPALVWCHLNDEADLLERSIPDAVQVSGSDSDEDKEARLLAFAAGEIRVLVTKPQIGAWGLNFQHCAHVTFFPSHSFEQYYQGVRRCWRFGQEQPVTVDVITTEGERAVLANLQAKAAAAAAMFTQLVALMNNQLRVVRSDHFPHKEELPSWL